MMPDEMGMMDAPKSQGDAESRLPSAPQIILPTGEQQQLIKRLRDDWSSAQSSHEERKRKFKTYLDRWRRQAAMEGGEQGRSNFAIPLIKSQVGIRWAKSIEQLFGEDAEIVAVPTGPSDQRNVHKIGRYMTWLLFQHMNLGNELVLFEFNKIMYGRAIAFAPYESVDIELPDGEVVQDWAGPGFHVLDYDDFVVPPENPRTLHEFSFIFRRFYPTLDELLDGEEAGRYYNISENFQKILDAFRATKPRASDQDQSSSLEGKREEQQGYSDWGLSNKEQGEGWEWYGRWRMLREEGDEASETYDDDKRERRTTELCVKYLPQCNLLIGCQKLIDLYPRKRNRRPFVESSLQKDGSYWPQSLPEILVTIEDELTHNHNLGTEAIERSIGPLVLYRPGAGFDPQKFKYEPYQCVPVEDPAGINLVKGSADIGALTEREHTDTRWGERATGLTDLQAGRASDRPNAPRTFGQARMIAEESNIRIYLDTTVTQFDYADILKHFWELDSMYGSPETFFRVTEEEARGLFETEQGGAVLTQEERAGRFDFRLKFASSIYSREARKADSLALYQIDLQNPLIVQDPRALWAVTNRAHKAHGDDNFKDIVPEPPESFMPRKPIEEWNAILQGEDIYVHPQDNDPQHIQQHILHMAGHLMLPEEQQDKHALKYMNDHVRQHETQLAQKQQMAAMMSAMMGSMAQDKKGALAPAIAPEDRMLTEGEGQPSEMPMAAPQGGIQ